MNILGIQVDVVSMDEAVERVEEFLQDEKKRQIVTPNPEQIVLAQKDKEFASILNRADLAIADGIGVVWASRFLSDSLPEKVTGTDLMLKLCEQACQKGWSVFLLGGEEGVAKQAAIELQKIFPGIKVAGASSADPFSNLQPPTSNLLFVAYGAPTQEKWIAQNLSNLPVKVAMGVGGGIDFITGVQKRAPRVVRKLGMEWLWRLLVNPVRFKRIFNAVVVFPLLVARHKLFTFSHGRGEKVKSGKREGGLG